MTILHTVTEKRLRVFVCCVQRIPEAHSATVCHQETMETRLRVRVELPCVCRLFLHTRVLLSLSDQYDQYHKCIHTVIAVIDNVFICGCVAWRCVLTVTEATVHQSLSLRRCMFLVAVVVTGSGSSSE